MAEQHRIENWRPVVGFEGWYAVSDCGRVKRTKSGLGARAGWIRRPQRGASGYAVLGLCRGTGKSGQVQRSIHRLVLAAFVGPCPLGQQVNHKNGVKTDNRLSNLEYVTPKQNLLHARVVLGRPVMEENLLKLLFSLRPRPRTLTRRGVTSSSRTNPVRAGQDRLKFTTS